MGKETFNENDILKLILRDNKMGWWKKDDKESVIVFSDYVKEVFALESNSIGYEEFAAMVREDYRDRIQQELLATYTNKLFDQIFPLNTKDEAIWVHAKELQNKKKDNYTIASGSIQLINDPEVSSPEQASLLRTNNLLFQLNSISQILLSFLQNDRSDDVIHSILKDMLKQFKAGRTYIFEYNWERQTQTNTYEVVDNNVKPEIDMLFELPFDVNTWWTEQMLAGKPVILSNINDLPPEAEPEREFLAIQDINSLFVAPLMGRNGAWGYAGVDIVDGYHTWTKEDTEWIVALINIISLCVQLQRSEKEAQLDKAYLENLYKNMPLGYIRVKAIFDENKRLIDYIYVDANSAVDRLFQKPITNLIGEKASRSNFVHVQKNLEYINKALQNESYVELDYYVDDADKYTRLVMYSVQKGEVICLFSDITESHNAKEKLIEAKEKAEVSDRLKSAFLANMSHEIRTPLNAIIGFSDLLTETEDVEERITYSNIVHENNELLLQLISDILDISKIEAGTLDIVNANVDVNQMCTEIIHSYNLKTAEIPVNVTFEQFLPSCTIYSDKNRLTQVINNFINNALKFTHEGGITLGYYLEGNDKIKFYVRDTGCGIEKENLPTIFNRFVKLNSFVPGTGLGLSICQSLVEQMGGEIGVESEIGKGSTFWFTHPYQAELQKPVVEQRKQTATEQVSAEKKELPIILVAEDTESNYLLLSNVLKGKYKLIHAIDGVEAVELFRQSKPDLILMDIKMPRKDGIEATKEIRLMDSSVPIIAVTAFAFDSDRERAIEAGCNDYLAKPIKSSELIRKINELINGEG